MYRIIGIDGKEYGPVSVEQLRQWIAEGRANAATRAFAEGTTEWKPLDAFPEFASLFPAAAPPRPGVAPPPGSGVAPVRRTNSFAVTGLVLGIISVTFGMCCCYGIPFNIIGIVFSLIAISQINQNPQAYEGKGMAVGGLVLSVVSLVLAAVMWMFFGAISTWSNFGHGHRMYRL
jgi:Domain of unknown function (DUF4190)/GYF domain 2